MGTVAIRNRSGLGLEPDSVLSLAQETFAVCKASGMSQRESAKIAGFHEDHGARLMKMPAVKERVNQLLESRMRDELSGHVSLAGINARCTSVILRMDRSGTNAAEREEAKIKLDALMNLAKLNGYVTDRKQTPAKPEPKDDLDAQLDALEPDWRARLEKAMEIADAEFESAASMRR